MSTKSRISYDKLERRSQTYISGRASSARVIPPAFGKQKTVSEGHPVSLLGKTDRDIGGFFSTIKTSYEEHGAEVGRLSFGSYSADDALALSAPPSSSTAAALVAPSSANELVALGATAIARTIPTNPHADISTFIGELREGLPSMVGRNLLRRPNPRTSAEEYLNWEFGLRPILNDFQKFGRTYVDREKILRNFLENAGKKIHRRYKFPDETSTTISSVSGYSYPAYVTALHGTGPGMITTETETTVKRWFSGCYSYKYPEGESLLALMQGFLAQARILAGLPSVETLWNLAPWSWAVDWFSNIGDIIHNFVEFSNNGLVMHYGYIMETKTVTVTKTFSGSMTRNNVPFGVNSSQVWTGTSKVRLAASPFGFGLTNGDLSPRQLAIAAALGLTRG